MKKQWIDFQSPLADSIKQFIAYKHSLRMRFHTEERALQLLDRFMVAHALVRVEDVSCELLEEFLQSRPRMRPRSYNHLLGVTRRFFNWLVNQEIIGQSPLRALPRHTTSSRRPFLFNTEQAKKLLEVATQLPDYPPVKGRGDAYRMIFSILYGLGLRVSEVCNLNHGDMDSVRAVLAIRETKFSKNRLVPLGPRMAERLKNYIRAREEYFGSQNLDRPLFSFSTTGMRRVHPCTVSLVFHKLVPDLHLTIPPGTAYPRLHDLRHSFAVNTLLRWYKEGINPSQRLIHLSTFLGHSQPASTAVYLTITAELLQEANTRFEQFVAPLLKEDL